MSSAWRLPASLFVLAFLLVSEAAIGQEAERLPSDDQSIFPRQGFMLSGYGGAGFNTVFAEGSDPNNFSTVFAPIMLFQVSDRFLFEGELEFEVEEGVTETTLEYAQVDVALSNNLTLVAGKFLLPFNSFSERLHPTWINRLISGPALYGGHGSLTPTDPLIPVLSDVGVQLRGAFSVGRFSTVTTEVFLTQGPALVEDEHVEDETDQSEVVAAKAGASATEAAALTFGGILPDNNDNKMIGGRIGYGLAPYFEVNLSGMTAMYDAAGLLRFSAVGAHVEGRHKSLTVHGEFIRTWQDGEEEENHEGEELAKGSASIQARLSEGEVETLTRNGYWLQVSYRHRKWQPVVRLTQVFGSSLHGETITEAGRQLALGIDYWFEPALAVKLEYLINDEENDISNNRLAAQLAFGF